MPHRRLERTLPGTRGEAIMRTCTVIGIAAVAALIGPDLYIAAKDIARRARA